MFKTKDQVVLLASSCLAPRWILAWLLGRLQAGALQLFGRLAVLETHTL